MTIEVPHSPANPGAQVSALADQAAALRAELVALRAQLAQAQEELAQTQGREQQEANELLAGSALRAQVIADTARESLDHMMVGAVSAPPLIDKRARQLLFVQEQSLHELREANEKLVLAALASRQGEATAQAAYNRQIAFLATVAHELRNPLMPLRLATQSLDRARGNEEAHARLRATITGQVGQMARLINDLLDGSRISTGKFRLERTVIDITAVLDLAVQACRPEAKERGQVLTVAPCASPIKVLGDSMRLLQVFNNLLGNATKYTPRGGEIRVWLAATGAGVSIHFADSGIGISAEALPQVFELFVQDEHATVAAPGGLGIGLAIVRELVKAHEGTVSVLSEGMDRGSEFIVTLPLASAGVLAMPASVLS